MTQTDKLMQKLKEYEQEHRDLDQILIQLQDKHTVDFLQIQRLKKRKLVLKDKIIDLRNKIDLRLKIEPDENKEFQERQWGPITVILIGGIKKLFPENYSSFIWRLGLFISFGIIIYFLVNLISEFKMILLKNNTNLWGILLIIVSLQSSSAIYDITNGDVKILTALFVIGHFYFFCKKKYFVSSIFIIIGIYFKFHPIVFAFPYFVFSICSQNHRQYIFYLFIVGTVVSLISYPIQGIMYGSLYPLSIIFSVVNQSSDTIPIWSQEIFNPLSIINKMINGFQIEKSHKSIYDISSSISVIISLFTILLILSNILVGFILSRLEYRWKNDDQLRFIYLFFFQVIIGFLYLIFSMDLSIQHLLIPLISIYAPIFLFSATIHKFNDVDNIKIRFIVIYFIGLTLVGGFLPISIVNIIIPYDLIDKIVGNQTNHIGQYGRFIWYHVPLLGLLIIAYVTYSYSKFYLKKVI